MGARWPWPTVAAPSRPALGSDERGQLLILTGVLLVLGFVIIGSTVVQLQSVEESTSRVQRDALLDPVDTLISNFNQTVRDSVVLGHTNTTDFQAVMLMVEDRIRDAATRSGLYISAQLRQNPSTDIFWRDSRCGGYDAQYSTNGVIIGYDKSTETETIAGAVYDLHITDGRQTIRMPYYVRIYQCMTKESIIYLDSVTATTGTVSADWTVARLADDVGAEAREAAYGAAPVAALGTAEHVNEDEWSDKDKIKEDGGGEAKHINFALGDSLMWDMKPPGTFEEEEVAKDLVLKIDHRHVPGVTNDDIIRLKLSYLGAPVREWTLGVGPVEATYSITVGNSPSGNSFWTFDELEDARWEYMIDEQGLGKDVGRTYWVDYARLEFTEETIVGHELDATFVWPSIPPVYDSHTVEYRYKWTAATAGETVLMQVWDYTNARWDTDPGDQVTLSSTAGAWVSGVFALDPDDHRGPSNAPKLRLTDSNALDALPTDLDILYFDRLVLQSTVAP